MAETVGMVGARQGDAPPGLSDEMKVFIGVLERQLDQEFRIAERLDAKARGYLAAATLAVAAVQGGAIAFISRFGGAAGIAVALFAGLVLLWTGVAASKVLRATRTHESDAFDLDYAEELLPFAFHGEPVAVHNLANVLLRTLRSRRKANEQRSSEVVDALAAAVLASKLIAGELIVLIVAFAGFTVSGT